MAIDPMPAAGQPEPRKHKLRWYQFSLRSLMIFVTLWAIPCSWLGVKMKQAREQRAAVEWIEGLGGSVGYDYQLDASGKQIKGAIPPGPAWVRELLGDDFLTRVAVVVLRKSRVTGTGLERLKGIAQLRILVLDHTVVTDGDLERVKSLPKLEYLSTSRARGSRTPDWSLSKG